MSKKNGKILKCDNCGKEFYRSKSELKRKHHYCCSKCRTDGIRKENIKKLENKVNTNNLEEWLRREYIDNKRSTTSIRIELGIGNHKILELLKDFGIVTRKGTEAIKLQWVDNKERRYKTSERAKKNIGTYSVGRKKLIQIMKTEEYKRKQSISKMGTKNGMYGKRGELSSRYNSNLTEEDRINRRLLGSTRIWRESVFKRDNYICQCCGYDKGHILVAHHLYAYREYPKYRFDVDNGITLCQKCHKTFHHIYGYGGNTKEQFEEFLSKADMILLSGKLVGDIFIH